MSTVDKALSLLELFSESRPSAGLSELARLLQWDKSTVQRYVSDLTNRGLLEQDPRDKTYYLGASVSRLAMIREKTHPVAEEVKKILLELVDRTGETAHAAQFINGVLSNSAIVDSSIRGTRVYIDPSEFLPFHATASGIAFLSASNPVTVKRILAQSCKSYTENTVTDREQLIRLIERAKATGLAHSDGGFESDVIGIAAPVLGFDGAAVGSVAVATPSARFTSEAQSIIEAGVLEAGSRISKLYGAEDESTC